MFTDNWKVLVLNFSVMGNTVFFWVKKLMEKIIFTDYWKVLILNFSVVGNTVFFWVKKLMEDDIYWLLKSSYFDFFGGGKYGLFWVKKLMQRSHLLVTEKFLFWTFR